ncbi:glutathione S-transferase [Rhodovarius crocodyli]|uniref:Glutathione S-transferase n=1 Tax=Rhodovarius crocodyli TaxID=1979269 RepID=A0A437M293_9PROT|nr:glutathione S-transferase [Rhodovarius crocodyli]RVT91696.1 glutathione S-transferase [Rhodovarius crocodyli]
MSGSKTRKKPAAPPAPAAPAQPPAAPRAVLNISTRNYSSWSMRGWLLARLAGLDFSVHIVSPEDPQARAELLNNSSSILLPCLEHEGARVWDTLGIAEYLNEQFPEARLFPGDRVARARCRSICGEMHAGFQALRASLPMNLRAHVPNFPVWSAARADIARIQNLWRDCLAQWGGPWLFGAEKTVADAMFAPVVTRFRSYDVKLDEVCEAYARTVESWPDFQEWVQAARAEPEARITELEFDAEF